jgi:hypothetical protein
MTSRLILKKIVRTIALSGLVMGLVSAQALTISPARDEVSANPGDTISGSFLLINEQDTEQTYYTSVEKFESQGETGTPSFSAATEGLATWIKLEPSVTLKKGERIKVPYTITVPQDAYAGGHYASIFLSTVPPSLEEGQVSVGAKMGMLILLKVSGSIKEEGGLLTFQIKEGKKVVQSLPIDFEYRFSNKGNDRAKPEGNIVIRNMFGMESASIDANKSLGNVLPNSVRRFDVRLGDVEAPKVSDPFFTHVKFQMNNFALGVYFANIKLAFGTSGIAESSFVYFVLPWQLLSVVGGGFVVIILLFIMLLKRYNRWVIKQARAAAK